MHALPCKMLLSGEFYQYGQNWSNKTNQSRISGMKKKTPCQGVHYALSNALQKTEPRVQSFGRNSLTVKGWRVIACTCFIEDKFRPGPVEGKERYDNLTFFYEPCYKICCCASCVFADNNAAANGAPLSQHDPGDAGDTSSTATTSAGGSRVDSLSRGPRDGKSSPIAQQLHPDRFTTETQVLRSQPISAVSFAGILLSLWKKNWLALDFFVFSPKIFHFEIFVKIFYSSKSSWKIVLFSVNFQLKTLKVSN